MIYRVGLLFEAGGWGAADSNSQTRADILWQHVSAVDDSIVLACRLPRPEMFFLHATDPSVDNPSAADPSLADAGLADAGAADPVRLTPAGAGPG